MAASNQQLVNLTDAQLQQQRAILIDKREKILTAMRSAEQIAELARRRLEKGDISEQELARVVIETERARGDDALLRAARQLAAVTLAQAAALSGDRPVAAAGWPALPTLAVHDANLAARAALDQRARPQRVGALLDDLAGNLLPPEPRAAARRHPVRCGHGADRVAGRQLPKGSLARAVAHRQTRRGFRRER